MDRLPTTLKRLEVFICYMERLNMGHVANALELNALSVYRSIHTLEKDIGCILFEKKGRNLVPLKAADILYQQVTRVIADLNSAIISTKLAAGMEPDRLRIGTVNSLAIDLLPHLVKHYPKRRPDVRLSFTSGSNAVLFEKLKCSDLDAITVYDEGDSSSAQYTSLPLFEDELCLAMASDSSHPIDKPIERQLFIDAEFMVLEQGFGLRKVFDSAFEQIGITAKIHSEFSCLFGMCYALQAGYFYTLLPKRLTGVMKEIGVTLYPLNQLQIPKHTLYLLMNRACEHSHAMRALVAECRIFNRLNATNN